MTNYTAPRTWVAGETPTDAMLNVQVRDNMIELMRATNLWAHNLSGSPAAGGVIPFRMQCGTNIATSDAAGTNLITFPVGFPNACMVVIAQNSDYTTNGDVTFAMGGLTPSLFGYGVFRSGALVASVTHRINWIAIGW